MAGVIIACSVTAMYTAIHTINTIIVILCKAVPKMCGNVYFPISIFCQSTSPNLLPHVYSCSLSCDSRALSKACIISERKCLLFILPWLLVADIKYMVKPNHLGYFVKTI